MTDKERMDFLERMPGVTVRREGASASDEVEVFTFPSQHVKGLTLRSAIDTAMEYESGKRCWQCENWPHHKH